MGEPGQRRRSGYRCAESTEDLTPCLGADADAAEAMHDAVARDCRGNREQKCGNDPDGKSSNTEGELANGQHRGARENGKADRTEWSSAAVVSIQAGRYSGIDRKSVSGEPKEKRTERAQPEEAEDDSKSERHMSPPPRPGVVEDDEPVLEVDELEALEDDEIEVETGLPEPQAPASPLTEEERDQRLEVIKVESPKLIPGTKSTHRMHTDRNADGTALIEAKAIVGHGRFVTWVHEKCPFCHSTANNYMYVARANLKFARLTNLAEQGTVDAVEGHLQKRGRPNPVSKPMETGRKG